MDRKQIHRWIRRVWITAGTAFTAWMVWNVQSHGVAPQLTESTDRVTVRREAGGLVFLPVAAAPRSAAVVFLPGGGIAPRAYVPVVRGLADAGVPAALVELPYRTALTEAMREELWQRVLRMHTALGGGRPLVLAGHSRGGALAGQFAAEHRSPLAALVLIGTTHPRDQDLSGQTLPVLKVLGSRDCVASREAARANAHRLPSTTRWIEIEGANHAQFGYYGSQINDCGATISRESQQQQMMTAMLEFLEMMQSRSQASDGADPQGLRTVQPSRASGSLMSEKSPN